MSHDVKTAQLVKELKPGREGQTIKHFKVTPALEGYDDIVVSALDTPWAYETYIFPANAEGDITNWGELRGSQRDIDDIEKVLTDLGYTIKEN